MSWRRIPCDEFEKHLSIMGDHKRVYSSLTDLSGEFGDPLIETVWCRDDAPDEPILKGVRHPGRDVNGMTIIPDAAPCEHYFHENDGW